MNDNEWTEWLFSHRAVCDEYTKCIDRLFGLWCRYHHLEPSSYATWQRYTDEILAPVTPYQD